MIEMCQYQIVNKYFLFLKFYMSDKISDNTTPSANSTTVSMEYDLHSNVLIYQGKRLFLL